MTIYYVSTIGNDSSSGTISSPWGTIQKAADTMIAGDTVYIRGGTYKEYIVPQNSGGSGNYITYAAYPGENPVIDLSGMSVAPSAIIRISGKSYIKISGLTLQNNNPTPGVVEDWKARSNDVFGINIGNSHHITIEKNVIQRIASSGIWAWGNQFSNSYKAGDEDLVIDGNTLIDVNNRLVNINGKIRPAHEGISIYYTRNYVIRNNVLKSTWAEGIDAGLTSNHGRIYQNILYPGASGYNMVGMYVGGNIDDVEVYSNRIDGRTIGIGHTVESAATTSNLRTYNNIITNSVYYGILFAAWGGPGTWTNVYIGDNTVANSAVYGIWLGAPSTYNNVVVRNNILSKNANQLSVATMTGVTIDHNLIDGPSTNMGTAYVTGDPKFVNPINSDFHLQSTSPAIDKGSSTDAPSTDFDGNIRPQGSGYDIGAYEFVSGPPSTGSLSISSIPSEAEVFIDNIDQLVKTNIIINNIPTGTHTLKLTLSNYQDYVQTFSISSETTTTVSATLSLISPPPPSGLLAYWKFDEGSGNSTSDSGNAYSGLITNGTWTTGKVGYAISFAGNGYVDFGTGLNLTTPFTILMWIKVNSSPHTTWWSLITKGETINDQEDNYYVSITPSNNIYFSIGDGTDYRYFQTSTAIDTTDWHRLALVFGSSTDMRIYIDSVSQAGTYSGTATTLTSNSKKTLIGASSTIAEFFNGIIDEVMVYNQAFTSSQIQTDYLSYTCPPSPSANFSIS